MFVDWNDEGGEGRTPDGGYSVRAAKRILKKHPRDSVKVTPGEFWDLRKMIASCSYSGVRLDVPIILIPVGDRYWPIDGWSRITKAKEEGCPHLEAVILTNEEKEAIRTDRNPAGMRSG